MRTRIGYRLPVGRTDRHSLPLGPSRVRCQGSSPGAPTTGSLAAAARLAQSHTGRIVVKDALGRGHKVIAVARTHELSEPADENLINARADVRDPGALTRALDGANAVVSALGVGTSRAPTDVYSTGVRNTLGAMRSSGATRLAVISAVPAAPWAEQPILQRRIALPVLQRIFGATYDDMRRMEAILIDTTDVDSISLRPPRLVNNGPKGAYRIDSLARQDLYRHTAYVAN